MLSAFGKLLAAHLEAQGLSQREYARRVRIAQGSLQHVLTGRRKPPLKAIPRWAQVLKLSGEEERTFLLEAYLTHTPEYVVDVVRGMISAD